MNTFTKNGITLRQYILFIHGVQMGVGILSLPSLLAEKAGTEGWIAIIIGWLCSVVASIFIIQVVKKYPDGTIIDLLTHYFGKWIGKLGAVLFTLYFGLLAVVTLIRSFLFLQMLVFPEITILSLIILIAIPNYLIVRNSLNILSRYSELIFFMSLWMIIFFIIPLYDAHVLHILPVVKEGFEPILSAVPATIFSFIGFEVAFFLYPFLQKKQAATKGIVMANTMTAFAFLGVTIAVYLFFSPDEISQLRTPFVTYLKVIEFQFLERVEIIFLSSYLFVMSTTWMPFLFFTVFSSTQLVGKQDHSKHLLWFLIGICIYVFAVPPSFPKSDQLLKVVEKISISVAYLLPLFLLAAIWIRGLFQRRSNK